MKGYFLLFTAVSLIFAGSSMAMQGMEPADGTKAAKGMDHGNKAMEGMEHGNKTEDGSFAHTEMAGDIHVEFNIMDLASMNMKDSEGKTHHVMATFMRNSEKISKVVGKIKIISPSKKEQIADLKDYGGGIFAANFTIDEPGKWGVICLFKDKEGTQTVKFWYPHMAM